MPSSSDPRRDEPFDDASPSELRGAIDKGQTGEKVAGFSPASPMGTDAEAGGARTVGSNEPAAVAHAPRSLPGAHGSAMPPFDDVAQPKLNKPLLIYVGVIVVVAIVLIASFALWR